MLVGIGFQFNWNRVPDQLEQHSNLSGTLFQLIWNKPYNEKQCNESQKGGMRKVMHGEAEA